MTISYPLTLPTTIGAKSVDMVMTDVVPVEASPFTLESQSQSFDGQKWSGTINLPPMNDARAKAWVGFLAALRGRYGWFRMGPPNNTPRGTATGTPLVDGADQTGLSLDIDGAGTSVTGWLLAGDYIQIGDYLHVITQDVDTASDGTATLEIWPRLRASPADNDTVIVTGAQGLWRLSSNERQYSINHLLHYGLSFGFEEHR